MMTPNGNRAASQPTIDVIVGAIFMSAHLGGSHMATVRLFANLAIVAAILAFASAEVLAEDMRDVLAPTGRLRVGVFPSSSLSMIQDAVTGETHGLTFDLGKELAKRLDVPFEKVVYQRIAEVLSALKVGDIDFTISNATPARALDVAFSQTLLLLESGYLVPAGSPIVTIADMNKSGLRVGVSKGSTSEQTIPKVLANASVVAVPNLKQAIQMLTSLELDAFATNKAILFEMSDQMPRARVLDGRWGLEHLAVAIPKGRERGVEFVRDFVEEMRSSGLLAQAEQRAGIRGAIEAE
jgi:polar amino acid transport system substrate-binding protein